jgi:7-cyano-7-deazaguanine synthase
MESAIQSGTKAGNLKILTPVIEMSKAQIVAEAIKLNVDLSITWSCYKNNDYACGVCDSCRLRLRGFEITGKKDLIEYKNQ